MPGMAVHTCNPVLGGRTGRSHMCVHVDGHTHICRKCGRQSEVLDFIIQVKVVTQHLIESCVQSWACAGPARCWEGAEVQRMCFAACTDSLCSQTRQASLIYKWSFDPLRTVNASRGVAGEAQ